MRRSDTQQMNARAWGGISSAQQRSLLLLLVAAMTGVATQQAAAAVTPTCPSPTPCLWQRADARLFVMDNQPSSPSIRVVDITLSNGISSSSYNVSAGRVPLPGIGLQMGLTLDHTYLGVFRARTDNDQQVCTQMSVCGPACLACMSAHRSISTYIYLLAYKAASSTSSCVIRLLTVRYF